ncbi:MAG TPA: copper resistance protein NlpE N-terminal domain-containing protein [Edaphobacter sp.]|jgi:copper homeostasis protein (lipoprotein)|nr:copper resistance protein NlpE N-terminal domain-containing protein [Edaphobacter sp.]
MVLRSVVRVLGLELLLISASLLEAKTVTVGAADNRTDVFLNLGDTLVVELSSGDVSGFRWVSHLPKGSGLTALNEETPPIDKKSGVPVQVRRFRFNAASIGDTAAVFGFETPDKDPGAAPQDTSAYSVRVHIALGSPRVGTAVLLGVYKGTLPCADCDGLDTVLRIYAKGKFDFTYAFYVRTQTYRGAPHGDVAYSDRGEWTMLRGDATDENATVYQLNPENEPRSESLLLQDGGSSLVQLGKDLEPIDTTMNVTLKRVP